VSGARLYAALLVALIAFVPLAGATSTQIDPPTIDINSAPANPTNQTSATFLFTHVDDKAKFECQLDQLDSTGFSACESGIMYSGLGEGGHKFEVRAIVGPDQSEPAVYTWTIDTTEPVISLVSDGPDPTNNSSTISYTLSEPASVTLNLYDGGTLVRTLASGASRSAGANSELWDLKDDSGNPVPDGTYTYKIDAVDAATNAAEQAQGTVTIDKTKPVVSLSDDGKPPPVTAETTANFAFTTNEPSTLECKLDAAAFAACTSPKAYTGLADGSHTFQVRAIDLVGNVGDPASYTWTIDTVNPVVTVTDKPLALTNQTTATFTFTSNKTGSTFECKLDGAVFSKCTSPLLYSGLGDGSHTFAVRATAVTIGLPTTYSWRIDTVAPETTVTSGPDPVGNSTTATFTFSSSEPGSTFACSLDAGGISPCTSPTSYANLGSGAHTFRVQAVDAAGNADASPANYTWQVAGAGPTRADRTPPGRAQRVRRTVGYGLLRLVWRRPPDADFDHSNVFVSTRPEAPPRKLVYRGKATKYTNRRFKNGLYYRYAIVSYDHAGNASREVAVVVPPSALLRSPRNGRAVRKPPRFAWAKVSNATFYNIQVYYGAQKVLSAWPNSAKLALTRSWLYEGRRFRLQKGKYRWYVWPGFGPRARSRYGQLLGQAVFAVR
jgi:hypothetical protein